MSMLEGLKARESCLQLPTLHNAAHSVMQALTSSEPAACHESRADLWLHEDVGGRRRARTTSGVRGPATAAQMPPCLGQWGWVLAGSPSQTGRTGSLPLGHLGTHPPFVPPGSGARDRTLLNPVGEHSPCAEHQAAPAARDRACRVNSPVSQIY